MKFGYASEIVTTVPDLVAGVIWIRGVDNRSAALDTESLLSDAERTVRERYPEPPDIARDPAIAAWRAVYSSFGLTPNRYPCAAESLIRRVVASGPVPRISPLVDLCNSASLLNAVPVAPVDLRDVAGSIIVRRANGDEKFRAIGSIELQPVEAGEVVYADDSDEVLSRRWNWRQTGKSAIRPDTTDVLITTEAVHAGAGDAVASVLAHLESNLAAFAGARQSDTLTGATPWSVRR